MHRILLALVLGGVAVPSFAATVDTMSCAAFVKMDDADRMAAMGSGGMMSSGDTGGMMASGSGTGGAMKSGDSGGMMASGSDGGMTGGEHGMMMAADACAKHPDMTVGEAMKMK